MYIQPAWGIFKDVRRHEASAYQDVSIAQGSVGMEKFDHLFPPTPLIAILVAPQRSAPWPPVSRYSLLLVPLNILLRSSSRPSRHRAIARNVGMRAMRWGNSCEIGSTYILCSQKIAIGMTSQARIEWMRSIRALQIALSRRPAGVPTLDNHARPRFARSRRYRECKEIDGIVIVEALRKPPNQLSLTLDASHYYA